MRRRRATATTTALVLAAASGCSLFAGLDDYASEDPPAAVDAGDAATASDATTADATGDGTTDAGVDAPTDADGASGPVNIHPFSTFEDGCAGWGNYLATLAPSAIAHSGQGSCRVCLDSTDTPFFTADDNGFLSDPPIGAEYTAEVWIRSDPAKAAPPFAGLVLRTRNDNPFVEVEKSATDFPGGPTATWQRLTAKLTITKPAQKLNVVAAADAVANACFLLDDVAVYRTK